MLDVTIVLKIRALNSSLVNELQLKTKLPFVPQMDMDFTNGSQYCKILNLSWNNEEQRFICVSEIIKYHDVCLELTDKFVNDGWEVTKGWKDGRL